MSLSRSHHHHQNAPSPNKSKIQILPQDVVDRIAAGEVVQRPCHAVKELIENALDAQSTEIVVRVEIASGFLSKVIISDNGSGISKDDLALAATRHATSKFRSVNDFDQLCTFGFRGEALASISHVSRLTLTSRTRESPVAYQQAYMGGEPITQQQPKPCARQVGTTVTVEDLFHNLPTRKASLLRAGDEYARILQTAQQYAIHAASRGVGIVCEKILHSGRQQPPPSVTDVNTRTLSSVQILRTRTGPTSATTTSEQRQQATRDVIVHTYGSALQTNLSYFSSSLDDSDNNNDDEKSTTTDSQENASSNQNLSPSSIYNCTGFVTLSSYSHKHPRTHLILFVNDRLVECPPLKRAIDDAYRGVKPFVYVNVHVPKTHVDVNVHPTKQHVTLLHLDRICDHLKNQLQEFLMSQGQTFSTQESQPTSMKNPRAVSNPYACKRKALSSSSSSSAVDISPDGTTVVQPPPPAKIPVPPSKLIRTQRSSQAGALEPYLVSTQSNSSSFTQQSFGASSQPSQTHTTTPSSASSATRDLDETLPNDSSSSSEFEHDATCPLATSSTSDFSSSSSFSIDMSQPGAFAKVAALCNCRRQQQQAQSSDSNGASSVEVRLVRQAVVRPKKVAPTECHYTSIVQLRKRVHKHASATVMSKLRQAVFVGVVSHHRSLVQCGEELVEINHTVLASQMFYQLALWRFAGANHARLSHALDIELLVGSAVQLEDNLVKMKNDDDTASVNHANDSQALEPISDTNQLLAHQVATCLCQHAEMLEEYFSISIEHCDGKILLTGLPILLEGHMPSPHGLPLFLLRLATEVDWTEERPCFRGVCRELGSYYAMLSSYSDENVNGDENSKDVSQQIYHQVRHSIFPAVSSLLIPSKELENDDSTIRILTSLSKLYRVFERC